MENNPAFPNPPAALADLKKLLPEFQTALANAEGRDKQKVSIKNNKKANLLALLEVVLGPSREAPTRITWGCASGPIFVEI